jgi:hypothetical protein
LGDFPDQVYRFTVPKAGIRRWDDTILVYDVRLGETSGLRHYAFYDRWFVVNASLDGSGNLVTERTPGTDLDWCFNCDVTTPLFSVGDDAVFSVDLELDVLAGPDGRAHVVRDKDKFAASVAAGYINENEEDGARRGLADLRAIMDGEGLNAFLARICPPPGVLSDLPVQPPVAFLSPANVPLLLPDARRARYGQKG